MAKLKFVEYERRKRKHALALKIYPGNDAVVTSFEREEALHPAERVIEVLWGGAKRVKVTQHLHKKYKGNRRQVTVLLSKCLVLFNGTGYCDALYY